MAMLSKEKNNIERLGATWREIIDSRGLSQEVAYRLEKLILRLDVIVDKMFVKTVRAHDMLSECQQLTERFRSELNKHYHEALLQLTRLEAHLDELVRKTHEFRIKAG
jgi:hypothetical protein